MKRATTHRPSSDVENIPNQSDKSSDQIKFLETVKEVAQKLPYRQWVIIRMLYYENFTETEVACALLISLQQVQKVHASALQKIKDQLTKKVPRT